MSAFDPKRTLSDTLCFRCPASTGNRMHDTAWNRGSSRCNRNDMSKDTLDGRGAREFCVAGTLSMTPRDQYLLRAAEFSAMAQAETDRADKVEFENLARAYLRLAEQAERNSQADTIYETPLKKDRDQA